MHYNPEWSFGKEGETGEAVEKRRDVFLVREIDEDSPAAAAGFKAGDIIIAYDGVPVSTMEAYQAAAKIKEASPAIFSVLRGLEETTITAEPKFNQEAKGFRLGLSFDAKTMPDYRIAQVETENGTVKRYQSAMFDVQGEKICDFYFDIGTAEGEDMPDIYANDQTKLMDSFVLFAKDGKPYDLIKEQVPSETPVYMSSDIIDIGGVYSPGPDSVFLNGFPWGNPNMVSNLMHEKTHAEQYRTERFESIGRFYDAVEYFKSDESIGAKRYCEFLLKKIKLILETVRDFGVEMPFEPIEGALATLTEKYDAALGELLKEKNETYSQRRAALVRAREQLLGKEVAPNITVEDILLLPRRIMERDADRGALVALRQIKTQTGIDLFAAFKTDFIRSIDKTDPAERLAKLEKYLSVGRGQGTVALVRDIMTQLKEGDEVKTDVLIETKTHTAGLGATASKMRAYKEAKGRALQV